jgi:diguanylate cyclase (GGDEF)-like protein
MKRITFQTLDGQTRFAVFPDAADEGMIKGKIHEKWGVLLPGAKLAQPETLDFPQTAGDVPAPVPEGSAVPQGSPLLQVPEGSAAPIGPRSFFGDPLAPAGGPPAPQPIDRFAPAQESVIFPGQGEELRARQEQTELLQPQRLDPTRGVMTGAGPQVAPGPPTAGEVAKSAGQEILGNWEKGLIGWKRFAQENLQLEEGERATGVGGVDLHKLYGVEPPSEGLKSKRIRATERQQKQIEKELTETRVRGMTPAQQYLHDIGVGAGTMIPTLAVGAVAGPWAGLAPMAAQVFGAKYGEDRLAGKDEGEAALNAAAHMAFEVGPERIPLGMALKMGTPFLRRMLMTAAAEAPSEVITGYLQGVYDYFDEKPDASLGEAFQAVTGEAFYSGMVGAGMGLTLGLGGAAINSYSAATNPISRTVRKFEKLPREAQDIFLDRIGPSAATAVLNRVEQRAKLPREIIEELRNREDKAIAGEVEEEAVGTEDLTPPPEPTQQPPAPEFIQEEERLIEVGRKSAARQGATPEMLSEFTDAELLSIGREAASAEFYGRPQPEGPPAAPPAAPVEPTPQPAAPEFVQEEDRLIEVGRQAAVAQGATPDMVAEFTPQELMDIGREAETPPARKVPEPAVVQSRPIPEWMFQEMQAEGLVSDEQRQQVERLRTQAEQKMAQAGATPDLITETVDSMNIDALERYAGPVEAAPEPVTPAEPEAPAPPAPEVPEIAEVPAAPTEERRVEDRRKEDKPVSVEQRKAARREEFRQLSFEEQFEQAQTDELTGLGNRTAYEKDVRFGKGQDVFIKLDGDSLKWINDNLGHAAGDDMLRGLGLALQEAAPDRAYRIGGDEFDILNDSIEQAEATAPGVTKALDGLVIRYKAPDGTVYTFPVGVTYGIGRTAEEADANLESKKQEKEAAGERAPRGERPPAVVEKPPEGREAEPREEGPEVEEVPDGGLREQRVVREEPSREEPGGPVRDEGPSAEEAGPGRVLREAERSAEGEAAERELTPQQARTRALEGIDKAEKEGVTTRGAANIARHLTRTSPIFQDADVSLEIAGAIREATRAEVEKAGLEYDPESTFTVAGETLSDSEANATRTIIRAFEGHNADTIVEEFMHGFYDSLTDAEQATVEAYRQQRGDDRPVNEFFAQDATTFFFSEKLHEAAGGVREVFNRAREALRDLINRIRAIRGVEIPIEVERLYRQAGGELARPAREAAEKKTINAGQLGVKTAQGFSVQTFPRWKKKFTQAATLKGYKPEEIKQIIDGAELVRLVTMRHPEMLTEPTKGRAIKGNVEHVKAFDLDARCPKQNSFRNTRDAIEKDLGEIITRDENYRLALLMQEMGKTYPCLICYVETRRFVLSDRLKALAKEQGIDERLLADPDYYHAEVEKDPSLAEKTDTLRAEAQKMPSLNVRKDYTPYGTQLLTMPQKTFEESLVHGGFRFFASTDWQAEHTLDIMQGISDLALRGGHGLTYTKERPMVQIFGKTNMKINMSLFAKGGVGGTPVAEDSTQGWSWAEAKDIVDSGEYPDVGATLVATSDAQIRWAMDQDWIGMILPWHQSGADATVPKEQKWTDFTRIQNDKWEKPKEHMGTKFRKETKPGKYKKGDPYEGVLPVPSITHKEHQNDPETYLALAEERGLLPRFAKYIYRLNKDGTIMRDETGNPVRVAGENVVEKYFKLVTDHAAWTTPQLPVVPNFDTTAAINWIENWQEEGGPKSEKGRDAPADMEVLEEFKKRRAQGTLPRPEDTPTPPLKQTGTQIQRRFLDEGPTPKTGEPVAFTFVRNTESSKMFGKEHGKQFASDIEPAGRYMIAADRSAVDHLPPGWESGDVSFESPLVLPWGTGTYQDADNWKQVLHERYGKKGRALSTAIRKDGHDGIITTRDTGETSEIVDLKPTGTQIVKQPGTPEFQEWFEGSEVVDSDGDPMVVYHGTRAEFEDFSLDKVMTGHGRLANGVGFSFTDNKDSAKPYIRDPHTMEDTGRIVPFYLSIKKPFRKLGHILDQDASMEEAQELTDRLKSEGYDGVIIDHVAQSEYVIFEPDQATPVKPTGTQIKVNKGQVEGFAQEIKDTPGIRSFDLFVRHDGTLELSNFETDRQVRKEGVGTAAMEKLEAFADENGYKITLTPAIHDPYHGTTSRGRLVKFYKRFGFVENKGRNKDFALPPGMYREPRKLGKKSLVATGTQIKTSTPAFKEWFGDSKVVNEDGSPRVVYHGTHADIEEFLTDGPPMDEDEFGDYTRIDPLSGTDPNAYLGAHFAAEPEVAGMFTGSVEAVPKWLKDRIENKGPGGRIYPLYLSLQDPLVTNEEELYELAMEKTISDSAIEVYVTEAAGSHEDWAVQFRVDHPDVDTHVDTPSEEEALLEKIFDKYEKDSFFRAKVNRGFIANADYIFDHEEGREWLLADLGRQLKDDLIAQGHDGVIYKNEVEGGTSYIAFSPEQIKSVFNNGTFGKDEPKISYQIKKTSDDGPMQQPPPPPKPEGTKVEPLELPEKTGAQLKGAVKELAKESAMPGRQAKLKLPPGARAESINPEVETRYNSARGATKQTFLDRAREKLGQAVKDSSRAWFAVELDPKKHGAIIDLMRQYAEVPAYSRAIASDQLAQFVRPLDAPSYDVFTRNVILPDLMRDIERGIYTQKADGTWELPFGYETPAELTQDIANFERIADGNPHIRKALDARQSYVRELGQKLVDLGLLKSEVLDDDAYFHHQVLAYMAANRLQPGLTSSDVRTHKKGFQIARVGSSQDYNTEYLEAEFEWMAQATAQAKTAEILEEIRDLEDIKRDLDAEAKQENLYAVHGGKDKYDALQALRGKIIELQQLEQDSGIKQQLKMLHEKADPLDVLGPFRQKKAIAKSRMEALAQKGALNDAPKQFDDIVAQLMEPEAYIPEADDSDFFGFVSWLSNQEGQRALPARAFFKAIQDEKAFIRKTLEKEGNFKTWKNFVPEGYTVWQPKQGTQFYQTMSLPERVITEILEKGEGDVSAEDLRSILAVAGPLTQWVLPEEVAFTLDNFKDYMDEGYAAKLAEKLLNKWKQWILLNPFRAVKYMLNNATGDLDVALASYPRALRYAPQAAADLYRYVIKKETATPEIREALELAVIDSGISVHEIPDIKAAEFFKHLRPADDAGLWEKTAGKGWDTIKNWNTWREGILRLAMYRYVKDEQAAGKTLYGASKREELDDVGERRGPNARAAKLARELIGDYGAVTATGQYLRRRVIPFWSWMEINAPRYVRLYKNSAWEGVSKGRLATGLGVKGGLAAAKLTVRAAALYATVQLWNFAFHRDEEKDLGEQRKQVHVILGRDDEGFVKSIRFQGALSDALAWLGLENLPFDFVDMYQGKKTGGELAWQMLTATPEKIGHAVWPLQKVTGEFLVGRKMYPSFIVDTPPKSWSPKDIFETRPIRDRWEHAARTFSMDRPYRWAFGLPRKGLFDDITSTVAYTTDPGQAAYYEARHLGYRFLDRHNIEQPGVDPTKKSDALYYYKMSQRLGDFEAAEKYLKQYQEIGGTVKGFKQSMRMSAPDGMIKRSLKRRFFQSLTPHEVDIFRRANEWYRATYTPKTRKQANKE